MKLLRTLLPLIIIGLLLISIPASTYLAQKVQDIRNFAKEKKKDSVIITGILSKVKEKKCENRNEFLCFRINDENGKMISLIHPDSRKLKTKTLENLIGKKVEIKGRKLQFTESGNKKNYVFTSRIWDIAVNPRVIKVAEFSPQTADIVPWTLYDSLNLDAVYGRLTQTHNGTKDLEYVRRYGMKKYIPQSIGAPSASLLNQMKEYGDPEYAVCLNEQNNPAYFTPFDIPTTSKYLSDCIGGFQNVWPNIKIIVNLGSQTWSDGLSNPFPEWPKAVWPAFETHMDDIYGFGLHYYPTFTCSLPKPKGWPVDPDAVIECVGKYIATAKELLTEKGVDKALVFTEFGIDRANNDPNMQPWHTIKTWNKLWDLLRQERIEFLSIYATTWFPDKKQSFNPTSDCPNRDQYSANSLIYPCQNGKLTPYGNAYSQVPRALP